MATKFCGVKGYHNGRFNCGLLFGFNPLTCIEAPPKVRKIFLGKSLEECRKLAEQNGFEFIVHETLPNPKYDNRN